MVLLPLLGGCSSDTYQSSPATTGAPATTTTVVSDVTVRGLVAQTLTSARVIVLAQPVSGFANVALTDDTEVVRATGAKAALSDIAAGTTVEATGRPGTPGSLLARRVVLL